MASPQTPKSLMQCVNHKITPQVRLYVSPNSELGDTYARTLEEK